MILSRRTALQLSVAGAASFVAGCNDRSGSTPRKTEIDGYLMQSPPDEAPVTRYPDEVELQSPLLEDLAEFLLDLDKNPPARFDQRDYIDIRRGRLDRDSGEVPFIWFESEEYTSEIEEAVEILGNLPAHQPDHDEDTFFRGVHLKFEERNILFQHEILWATP